MILELLLDLIYGLFNVLTAGLSIAAAPLEMQLYTVRIAEAFLTGVSFLANFVDIGYLMILFGFIIVVDSALLVYHFVMWIIRKIPLIGIS